MPMLLVCPFKPCFKKVEQHNSLALKKTDIYIYLFETLNEISHVWKKMEILIGYKV